MLHWLLDRARETREIDEDALPKRDALAWQLSMAAHLLIFIVLAMLAMAVPEPPGALEVVFAPEDEEEEPIVLEEFHVVHDDEAPLESAVARIVPPELADALPPAMELSEPAADLPPLDVAVAAIDFKPNLMAVGGRQLASAVAVRGLSGAAAGSVGGAVDRLTQEILASLEQRPTLVVWLLDASPSMRPKREQIGARFANIYRELAASRQHGHRGFAHSGGAPLLSSVLSFGQDQPVAVTREPTDDFATLAQAIAGIEDDRSGMESTFTAIGYAADKYAPYRRAGRNVLLIVATDEAGDDAQRADATIAALLRHQMPVYVIGSPSPFGCEKVPVRFHVAADGQYSAGTYWVQVRLGPESAAREVLQLAYWQQFKNLDPRLIDSGFGPFHLSRLCHETGGIYFSVHPGKRGETSTADVLARFDQFFDPLVMRRYAPDYVSDADYLRKLQSNKARAALVHASNLARAMSPHPPPARFAAPTVAALKASLDNGQKSAARLEPRLLQLYEVLKLGEADRAKLVLPRWQAGYDLAMGRVCAARVRVEGYNSMLAGLKRGEFRFEKPDSDTWDLRPSDKVLTGSVLARMADKARTYLQRVVDEHPGTPWAFQAEQELATPLGWEWREAHTGAGQPRASQPGNGGNRNLPRDIKNSIPKRPRRVPVDI